MEPPPLLVPTPHPAQPSQHPCCEIPSHLSCIKCKLQCIALTYAVEEGVWCVGCCPILSWINTRAICRLADTEMFVFQGNLPSTFPSSSLPPPHTPSSPQTQRWRIGKSLPLNMSLWSQHWRCKLLWQADKNTIHWSKMTDVQQRKSLKTLLNSNKDYCEWLTTVATHEIPNLKHRSNTT